MQPAIIEREYVGVSELLEYVKRAQKEAGGLRQLARKWKMPYANLDRIAKQQLKKYPSFETMEQIAHANNLPTYEVARMAGITLELPTSDADRVHRLMELADRQPDVKAILDRLLRLSASRPDFVDALLQHIRFFEFENGSQATDQQ